MNRVQLTRYLKEQYQTEGDHPWIKYPRHTVFRHSSNKKWFALVMEVDKSKLGAAGDEKIDILNVKCDPLLIGSLQGERGFYPAYHMCKRSWITIALDGSVEEEKIKGLLAMSFEATLS